MTPTKSDTCSSSHPLVAIIIVTYKTRAMTAECIESLDTHLSDLFPYEIVLVDNDSNDGTAEWADEYARTHPEFHYLRQHQNLGFARANNIGIAASTAPIILLLNSDTQLIDATPSAAVAFLNNSDDTVFACGCTLLNADSTRGISYGTFPRLGTVVRELSTRRFGQLRGAVPPETAERSPIDFPCGAFFAFKRKHLHTIGGPLDEHFFMYFEETDLAARAHKAGLSIWYIPEARLIHLGGGSYPSSGNSRRMLDYYRSWQLFMKKHASPLESHVLKYLLVLFYLARWIRHHITASDTSDEQVHLRSIFNSWKSNAETPTD